MEFKEVHSDERRKIFANSELLNGKEISIIKLNKLKAIGGCIHNKLEYFAVISGCVLVCKGKELPEVMLPGESGEFEKGTPHAFIADEDSIIMEWGITEEDKKKSKKDKFLLNVVNEMNRIKT
jgi:hypothetical protein